MLNSHGVSRQMDVRLVLEVMLPKFPVVCWLNRVSTASNTVKSAYPFIFLQDKSTHRCSTFAIHMELNCFCDLAYSSIESSRDELSSSTSRTIKNIN